MHSGRAITGVEYSGSAVTPHPSLTTTRPPHSNRRRPTGRAFNGPAAGSANAHHPHGRRLGTAHLADQATDEQRAALRRARATRARRLRAEAKAAEQLRRDRFAPATTPPTPAAWTPSPPPRPTGNRPATTTATSPSRRCPT
ncbi:hypothetical protein [Embleya sp. MST-111070]|uniref:hypothetical protein n=1 Tax=Embleya sp. MST-111070 TaxID=3398231 RepID=UPI003F73183B